MCGGGGQPLDLVAAQVTHLLVALVHVRDAARVEVVVDAHLEQLEVHLLHLLQVLEARASFFVTHVM